ncbi:MAG: SURF1 family protein [Acidiferrobacteraceae bacterium]
MGIRPGLWPTLAAIAAIALFVRLGFWQLHRAHQAQAQRDAYQARIKQTPMAPGRGLWDPAKLRFRRVVVSGRYDPRHQILLDNQFSGANVGYDVLTPLHLAHSRFRVLVNRGWIPFNGDRAHPPLAAPLKGRQHVVGLVSVPGRYFRLGRPRPPRPWHPIWEYLDLKLYRRAVPFPVEPVVILLSPRNAGGYVRHWPPAGTKVAMYEGYAIQWFLFALIVVVIYVVVNRSKHHDNK